MKPDILDLLATPPARGDKIEIEGLSLSAALAHPVLGPALEDFQSRLHWSKNDSLEDGAAGIELFLLAHAFAQDARVRANAEPGVMWTTLFTISS